MKRDAWSEDTDLYNHANQHEGVEVEDSSIKDEAGLETVPTLRKISSHRNFTGIRELADCRNTASVAALKVSFVFLATSAIRREIS